MERRSAECKTNKAEQKGSFVSCSSQRGRGCHPNHRNHCSRVSHALATLELNNIGVELIERDQLGQAVETLRSSIEILTERREKPHSGHTFEVAKAKEHLNRADSLNNKQSQQQKAKSMESASALLPSDCTFACARPVRIPQPSTPIIEDLNDTFFSPSLQALLAVLSYNLALAHHIDGANRGQQSLIDKATQLYKISESILLKAAQQPEALRGIEVTYLARAIVNNMGQILFEWGDPDSGREYFDGLCSVCLEYDNGNKRCDTEVFIFNSLVARGLNSAPTA